MGHHFAQNNLGRLELAESSHLCWMRLIYRRMHEAGQGKELLRKPLGIETCSETLRESLKSPGR